MENKDLTTVITNKGEKVNVIDSREVAEMMGKKHGDVLEYIEGKYNKDGSVRIVGIIPTLENGGVRYQDYFIESAYKAGTREYKCYLVTKMGCEMLGNKQQGEKGILFTAKYVERFNQMEEELKKLYTPSYMIEDPIKRAEKWIEEEKERQQLREENNLLKPKGEYHDKVLNPTDEENGFTKLITTTDIAKDLGMTARKLNKVLNDKGIIYKQGKVWKVYSEYEFLIKEKYCDYHITEYSQTLKWTEKGRKFIIELLENENKQ